MKDKYYLHTTMSYILQSSKKTAFYWFFWRLKVECEVISLRDQIERSCLPSAVVATASLNKISVISPVNGNNINDWLLSTVSLGNDWIRMLFSSGLLNVRVPCPLRFCGSMVTVSLSKLTVKSMLAGVSSFSDIKISTYPLLVLYAISRPCSAINVFSWRERMLAVKTSGLLTT